MTKKEKGSFRDDKGERFFGFGDEVGEGEEDCFGFFPSFHPLPGCFFHLDLCSSLLWDCILHIEVGSEAC